VFVIMANSLIDQLRALLLEMKERSLQRHQAFTECEEGFARRSDVLEKSWQLSRQQLEESHAQRQQDLQQEYDDALQNINRHHDEEHVRLTDEYTANRNGIEELHATEKGTAEAGFKETQWTILTLNESDKRVARDQLLRGHHKLKEYRSELKSTYLQARKLIRSWKFARNLSVHLNYQPKLKPTDPWKNLEQRRDIIVDCRQRLQGLPLPRYLEGRFLLLAGAFAWSMLVVPAVFMTSSHFWLLIVSVLTVSVVVPLAGWLTRLWMKRKARLQVALLWQGLAQAFIEAKPLRQLCLQQARKAYKTQRKQSRALYRLKLQKAVDKFRRRKRVLKTQLRRQLTQVEQAYQVAIALVANQRDDDLRTTHENFAASHQKLVAECEQETRAAEDRHTRLVKENDARHLREWQKLVEGWQATCQSCDESMQAIQATCERDFPSWETLASTDWQPPDHLPDGLPMGTLEVSAALIPHSEPEDPQLAKLSLINATLPALLPFPEKASVLFKAVERGREIGIRALEALLLRAWTCLPPGKLRCTIIDPVGRGENFAAFMHLADQDESLITSRIWTETSHIDQRLADLTSHMETVLQKFLRNRYETLAEYNAQAGEVAEPFRLLVVAHFPVNFSTDAARRLISLASAGARCGIYTLVMVDAKQPMPHGVELADLEEACINLVWREGHFRWRDAVFGDYPLTLAAPPAPEGCTSILTEVGTQAKLANRVEVPFESIAPPPEEMWTSDSRGGIAVPLGRAGANAFQLLTLGKGTSQHALIAGKTGSGKSTLLHVLIMQLALRYSPDEVELYLIDFKKGVEFKTYASHHLPHARVVAVESEREFGLSVLQRLDAELVERGELFRKAGVNDLAGYRNEGRGAKGRRGQGDKETGRQGDKETGSQGDNSSPPLPVSLSPCLPVSPSSAPPSLARIMLIVDEFQEFFIEDDKIAQETALLLDRLVRQGRAFGIHVILGSQTLGGAYSLARSTIDQMAVRIALQCSEADAHLILSKENSEARLLSRPGEAIYNAANGLLEGNNLFQIVWLTDQRRDDYLVMTEELARTRGLAAPSQVVFEGSAPSDLAKNPCLLRMRAGHKDKFPGIPCWLGESVAIKDPTAAFFRRQSGGNLLMAGQNGETAFSLMVSSLVSLAAQQEGRPWPIVYPIVLGTALDAESEAFLNKLPEVLPVRLVPQRELPELLAGLSEELQKRQKDGGGESMFLFLHGLQRMRDLRRADDDFGYGRRGEEKPSPSKLFLNLLREGPPLGIFTILWCDTMTNLQRSIDRQAMREFEMRVLFSMNAADSSNLMDSPLAAKLGPHRALFYSEDQGKTEKFRPYGLPTFDWLRTMGQ
jgi:energy-coupling factor transporter ATP-binding protein EcfA2